MRGRVEVPCGSSRSLRLLSGLAAVALLAALCVAVAGAGAATPPGQIPKPPGANPANYGWEKVSPEDKGGSDIAGGPVSTGLVQTSPNGDSVVYRSYVAFGDAVANGFPNVYQARRGPNGWSTHGILPPFEAGGGNGNNSPLLYYLSPDHSQGVVSSNLQLDPAAPPSVYSFYGQDLMTGERTLLTRVGPEPSIFQATQAVIGVNPDMSRIVYVTDQPPFAGDPRDSMYMAKGGVTEAISRLPDGQVTGITAFASGSSDRIASEDLDRVYFRSAETQNLYLWEEGDVVEIYGEEVETLPDISKFEWVTATPDGSEALYWIRAGEDHLRHYDAETETSTPILVPGESRNQEIAKASDDLSRIYIRTESPEEYSVWLWDNGELRLIADGLARSTDRFDIAGPIGGSYPSKTSYADPTGRFFTFTTASNATDYDSKGSLEVYLYDADADETICVSCPSGGSQGPGESTLGFEAGATANTPPGEPNSVPVGYPWAREGNVTSDGIVFFQTNNALVPQDTNRTMDVYRWEDGHASLVSSGTVPEPSWFKWATPDGSSVAFLTPGRLVSADRDDLADVYVARSGGGFPEPSPPGGCSGDGCQAASGTGPELFSLGSNVTNGKGNVTPEKSGSALHRVSAQRSHANAAVVTVQVSGPGRITASGKLLRTARRKASKAGTYRLRLPVSAQGTRSLIAGKAVRSRVRVVFWPQVGKQQTRSLNVVVRPKGGR